MLKSQIGASDGMHMYLKKDSVANEYENDTFLGLHGISRDIMTLQITKNNFWDHFSHLIIKKITK